MDRPDVCILCFETFGEKSLPRILPCGHSYCTDCLQKLIRNFSLSCPECLRSYQALAAASFPINYGLEGMVANCKKICLGDSSVPLYENGQSWISKYHNLKTLANGHLDSTVKMKTQLCDYDVYLQHAIKKHENAAMKLRNMATRHDFVVQNMKEVRWNLADLQREGDVSCQELKDSLNRSDNDHARSNYESATLTKVTENSDRVSKWLFKCRQDFPNMEIRSSLKKLATSQEVLEAIDSLQRESESPPLPAPGDHLTILEKATHRLDNHVITVNKLKDWLKPNEKLKQLVAEDISLGYTRTAHISIKGSKIYLHHLQAREVPPSFHTIKHSELIGCLDNDSTLAFLDISWNGTYRGRIHIHLSPGTLLAKQFRMLCTGESGPSYANTHFFNICRKNTVTEYILGGDYQNNDSSGGLAILSGIIPGDNIYFRNVEYGSVWTKGPQNKGNFAQFFIYTGGANAGKNSAIFGKVQDGFDVLEDIADQLKVGHRDVEVTDCGVVLSL